jgi:mono/diheme cytochrome c family protein
MLIIVLFLKLAAAEVPKTIPLPHIRGKELYDDLCFQCHGANGLANTPLAKSTGAPALAGKFSDDNYSAGIAIIQEGKVGMPAYEMVIDKHDSKRILIYLGGLDPETGMDPRVKEAETPEEDGVEEEAGAVESEEETEQVKPSTPAVKESKE